MTHFQKLRLHSILRWVSCNLSQNSLRSPEFPTFWNVLPFYTAQNHIRFYGVRALQVKGNEISGGCSTSIGKTPRRRIYLTQSRKLEAQSALLDYLYYTRDLPLQYAEPMSKNSPHFLRKLIGNVLDEPDYKQSTTRFLRYHPINEFEPFFESIGLEPSEFIPLLPRDLIFLSDEEGLLDNFHVLFKYGIAGNKMGKIFREAREVFRYGHGVLQSKLQAFEELGMSQPVIAEVVSSSPYLLIGDVGKEFGKVVSKLKCLGYEFDWVQGCLLENTSYNWRQIFELLCMLSDFGFDNKEMGYLIGQHPELLFDGSGRRTFSLIGFMLKFGLTKNDICSMFLQFPSIQVGKFIWNLRRVSELLTEINMDSVSIGRTICPLLTVLGSVSIKKFSSLKVGKQRLCDIIVANPLELKNWVLEAKVERSCGEKIKHSCGEKIKFLSRLGYAENSEELRKALRVFRGKGLELQERFDCLVKAGLTPQDVTGMLKAAPKILELSKDMIETKIAFLVNDLRFPVSTLKQFPTFLSFKMERVKLRYSMYKWLRDHKAVEPSLSLNTITKRPESVFTARYVNKHPRGPEVWEQLKKTSSSV